MKAYCPKCNKLPEVHVQAIPETFKVKGEKISITSEVAICDTCKSKIFHQELDENNLGLAYAEYRKIHNLLSPAKIADIRKKYSLSQRSLARLLEWGEITINRYENGAIQDPAHNEVLMFISDPKNMKELFEKNSRFLSSTISARLKEKINELIRDEFGSKFRISLLEDFISSSRRIDEYSGFASFYLDKMLNMILYIVERSETVFSTKLNKLLWYADFLNYKILTTSISGSTYIHLPLGPVPDDYKWIIAAAIDDGLLCEEEIIFSSGATGTQYVSLVPSDKSHFTKEERETMDFVVEYFKGYNGGAIKEKSHQERAYKETEHAQKISYKYAEFLSINLEKK